MGHQGRTFLFFSLYLVTSDTILFVFLYLTTEPCHAHVVHMAHMHFFVSALAWILVSVAEQLYTTFPSCDTIIYRKSCGFIKNHQVIPLVGWKSSVFVTFVRLKIYVPSRFYSEHDGWQKTLLSAIVTYKTRGASRVAKGTYSAPRDVRAVQQRRDTLSSKE